jgi:hypothetical protein
VPALLLPGRPVIAAPAAEPALADAEAGARPR